MKTILKYIIPLMVLLTCLISCDDWTETKAKDFDIPGKSAEYYQQLRDYKKGDHEVAFGWFGNWTGIGASLEKSMSGLPDSVDFVSMWGGWKNPSESQLKDLRFVQEVKGTKALVVFVLLNIGEQITPEEYNTTMEKKKEYWGWKDGDDASIHEAIKKYANAICDTIDKYNYDGFDLDWEPNYAGGPPSSYNMNREDRISVFIETMGKRIGPKSGTDRLFVIDGEPYAIPANLGVYFDRFIIQAYNCSGYDNLNGRYARIANHYDGVLSAEKVAKMLITTENFEDHALSGGYSRFLNPNYVSVAETPNEKRYIPSLKGMAMWQPTINGQTYKKGGAGTFHMEYEFVVADNAGTYPFLREAIRIMSSNK